MAAVTQMSEARGVDELLEWATEKNKSGVITGAIVILMRSDRSSHAEGAGSFQMGDAMWAWEVFKSRQLPGAE